VKVAVCVPTRSSITPSVRDRILECMRDFEETGGRTTLNVVTGKPIVEARTLLVERAMSENADALFFVDDDTLIEAHALKKLASHGDPFVTGLVFRKLPDEYTSACIGWRHERLMGLWQFSDDWCWPDYFEVDVCGLAAALIDMRLFRRITKRGRNWFDFNWFFTHESPSGLKSFIPQGEDIHLCLEAKRAGFRIYCDSSVRCGHLDTRTGRVYPSAAKWREFHVDRARRRVRDRSVAGLAARAGASA